jgi:hypothetical protein
MYKICIIALICMLNVGAIAQKPIAELPRVYIDSTWDLPTGGMTWAVHTSAQLTSTLQSAQPGDVIVLDAGVTYTGSFHIPAKSNPNHKWIYVVSSKLQNLPAGIRVSPANTANMPFIVSTNAGPAFDVLIGADHWRFSGLNMTETANISNMVFGNNSGTYTPTTKLADSITVDRCYIHGLPTASVHRAITANMSNFAIVDSYVSDIQGAGVETQGIVAWQTPGPFKIVNNYISATTEGIMFGGAGGATQPYIASDIEVRNNYFFKPLSWVGSPIAVVKNAFELKNAQRVLFDSNTIENVWVNGQVGFAVVLTVRTDQSGDRAVVNDINVTNNVLKNVVSGFNTLYKDDGCKLPACHNAGTTDRINIYNNLVTFYDPKLTGGGRNTGLQLASGTDYINGGVPGVPQDTVFQHNTLIPSASSPCFSPVLFADNKVTNNIWVLDNAFCREVPGPAGQPGITAMMNNPTMPPYDLTQRFHGNVMYVPAGDRVQTFPAHNYATMVPFAYVDSTHLNYQLVTPYWTDTSDGRLAGIDYQTLSRGLESGGSQPGRNATVGGSAALVPPTTSGVMASPKPVVNLLAH